MNNLRQRKLLEDNEETVQIRSSPMRPKPNKAKRFFIFSACVLIPVLFIGNYFALFPWTISSHATNTLDNLAYSLGLQKHTYAVVIDAGSTGSRVLAYSFHESLLDKNLKLDNEVFKEVKPGLSSFSKNPRKGAESLLPLLERAKQSIPESEWSKTPLVLKATAGLRLLPESEADALLQEVQKVFSDSPFYTTNNSVSIMDGVDEGLFSWFTVNFLLDRIGGRIDNMVAALDLGGGSTQITFAPTDDKTLKSVKPNFLHFISAFHQNITVYTQSYLGLGLMAARMAVLQAGNPPGATSLKSECINPIVHDVEWTYNHVSFKISGPENPTYKKVKGTLSTVEENRPIVNFEKCVAIIKAHVEHKVDKPAELNGKEVNAFSYYYDRATEIGLIDPFTGGQVPVKVLVDAASEACSHPNIDQPFMCLDLAFISVLLQDGFGLNPTTKLFLYKKIDGHEISWALGAAFHILQNGL